MKNGIPQGSVLSITLPSIAINKLICNISEGTKSVLYVDNLTIFSQNHSMETIEQNLQREINRILLPEQPQYCGCYSCPKTLVLQNSRVLQTITLKNQAIKKMVYPERYPREHVPCKPEDTNLPPYPTWLRRLVNTFRVTDIPSIKMTSRQNQNAYKLILGEDHETRSMTVNCK
ncbi:hypothetical protein JTB14_023022 [Gonioctena quinquepunctata]|nr:hypothetical protein JTB14_023022 [Gonioctena quinquepunctata]